MSEPFIAEIKLVGFTFAPRGWSYCNGQILPINQNQSLFALLGTTYGGDGRSNFALPDLRGRTPLHTGDGYNLGQRGGEEEVTLTTAQIPSHQHEFQAEPAASDTADPNGHYLAELPQGFPSIYATLDTASSTTMRANMVANNGGGQSHENMQPFLALGFCIAMQGLFPSRN